MIRFTYIVIINFIFSFGVESVSLPNNALEIASANSGIGDSQNIGLNFSGINNIDNSVKASSILWYQDVKGGNIEYKWGENRHHYLSLYSLSADDIDLRGIVPSEEPVDLFDVHHISLSYGFGTSISKKIKIGLKNSIIYNQLYTDESIGINFNMGISYHYSNLISFGIILNQFGIEKTNHSSIGYPFILGFGTTFNLKSLKSKIHTDIIYNNSFNNELSYKFSSITKFSFINIITGYNHSKSKNEFSCGFSFKYRSIEFEYGVSFHQALGMPTIFSLKYHL
tara:strand:- start:94 stop:939 length:846 start_codon:yes stop_codon:yes gene_type:complete